MTSSQFNSKESTIISEEVLGQEVSIATYSQGEVETQSSSSTAYVDSTLENGEILPWGVKAVWNGQDLSKNEDGTPNNFGEGSFAFVIDSGVLELDDLNINKEWSKSWIDGENAFTDGDGHGTHVAGTIAAKVDGNGVIGVAPGATIISLKVFDSYGKGGSYLSILEAIEHAAKIINENNLPKDKCVINMSLGGPSSPAMDQAIKNIASTGIQFAIAAGNESLDADYTSPAGAGDAENVYTVSAVDNKYVMANFSNWDDPNGGDDVDVAAPGVNVLSYYKEGKLEYLNGTSMAAPAVAGLLITGGLKEGQLVTPNAAGYSDPFAITTIEKGSDESPAPSPEPSPAPSPEPSPDPSPTPEAVITYIGDSYSVDD